MATYSIKHTDDPGLQQLWTRSDLPIPLYPFFDTRDLLTDQNDLVFRGQYLGVPTSLRKELRQLCTADTSVFKGASAEHATLSIILEWQQS